MNNESKLPPSCFGCESLVEEEKDGGIVYEVLEGGSEIHSITICQDCLNNPRRINVSRIIDYLKNSDFWEKEKIPLVEEALKKFKKGKMKLEKNPDGSVTYI